MVRRGAQRAGALPLQDGTLTPPGWKMEGFLTSCRIVEGWRSSSWWWLPPIGWELKECRVDRFVSHDKSLDDGVLEYLAEVGKWHCVITATGLKVTKVVTGRWTSLLGWSPPGASEYLAEVGIGRWTSLRGWSPPGLLELVSTLVCLELVLSIWQVPWLRWASLALNLLAGLVSTRVSWYLGVLFITSRPGTHLSCNVLEWNLDQLQGDKNVGCNAMIQLNAFSTDPGVEREVCLVSWWVLCLLRDARETDIL